MMSKETVESYFSHFLAEIIVDSPFVLIVHEQCLMFWRRLHDEYHTRTFPRNHRTLVQFIDELDNFEQEMRAAQEEMEHRDRAQHEQALRRAWKYC